MLPKPMDLYKTRKRIVQLQPQPTLQLSTHCLFILLFTYAKRLLKPTDLLDWRLPKLRDLSKIAKRFVQLQPSARNYCPYWGLYCRRTYLFIINSLLYTSINQPRRILKNTRLIENNEWQVGAPAIQPSTREIVAEVWLELNNPICRFGQIPQFR